MERTAGPPDHMRLAIADTFVWFDGAEQLLELVHIVKIDIQATDPDDLSALVGKCKPFKVQLLANKIETADELTACREIRFDLYQGFMTGRSGWLGGVTAASGLIHLASIVSQPPLRCARIGITAPRGFRAPVGYRQQVP